MEKILLKMARQLNGLDEASLMALWNKYMERVQDFDGSQEWEEASIVLSLIHAVRSKNHLFNANLAERTGQMLEPDPELTPRRRRVPLSDREKERELEERRPKRPATVLQFRPKA